MEHRIVSLHERLAATALDRPDAPFVVEVESGRTLSYGACMSAIQRLRQLLGSRPQTVAAALPGGIANAVVWLATLTGGHVLVPLPPDAPDDERARAAARTRPDVLIVDDADAAWGFRRPAARVITRWQIDELTEGASVPVEPPVGGYVSLTTSGTTGEPKTVHLSERQVAWTAEQVRISHRLTASDRGLAVLPFYHVNAPVVSLAATLMAGGTVVVTWRFSLSRFWTWIEDYQITWASIVPTIVAILLRTERPAFLPGSLRYVRTASAPLPVAYLTGFERKFGVPVVETYGLSEAASQVTANPVPPGERRRGSVGLPVGVSIRICALRAAQRSVSLADLGPGKIGEICVSGPSVIDGYVGGAGADAFQDGWFRTGDLGYRDADGYVYITGRSRDLIKRGGETISPREIEEVLLEHSEVADAAVAGRPDPIYGERVIAYVVAENRLHFGLTECLRELCQQRLSAYKVPEEILLVDTLPRNQNGKLNRSRLLAGVA